MLMKLGKSDPEHNAMTKKLFYVLIPVIVSLFFSIPAYAASSKADYYRGLDLYHQRDYQGSVRAFETHLKKVPDDPAAKKWLKKAIEEASRTGEVVEVKQPANLLGAELPSKSEKPSDDYEQGIALYRSGDYDAAMRSFQTYLKHHPKHVPTQQWVSLVQAHLSSKGTSQFMIEQLPTLAQAPAVPTIIAPKPDRAPQIQTKYLDELRTKETALETAQDKLAKAQQELERLRRKLAMRTQQVARAIRQSKRAISQTAEAERVSKALADQMNALGYAHERFTEELEAKSTQLKEAQEKLARAEKELNGLRVESESVAQARLATEKRLERVTHDRNQRFMNQMKAIRFARRKFAEELQAKETALASSQERENQLRTELETSKKSLMRKSADITGVEQALVETEEGLAVMASSKEQLAKVVETLRTQQKRLTEELQARERELAATEGREAALRTQLENTKRALSRRTGDATTIEKTFLETENKLAQVTATNEKLAKDIEFLQANETKLNKQLLAKEQALAAAQGRETELRNRLEGTQRILSAKAEDVTGTESALIQKRQELQDLSASNERLAKEIDALRSTQTQLTQELQAKEADLLAVRQQLGQTQSQLQRVLQEARAKEAGLISKLEEAKKTLIRQTNETAGIQQKLLQTEKSLAETADERNALANEVAALREAGKRLQIRMQKQQAALSEVQTDFAKQKETFQARLEEANAALYSTERTLNQVTTYYQMSENSRLAIESKLAEANQDLREKEKSLIVAQTNEKDYVEELKAAKRDLNLKIEEANRIEQSRRETESRLTRVLEDKRSLDQELSHMHRERDRLLSHIHDLEGQMKGLESQFQKEEHAVAQMRRESQAKIQTLQTERAKKDQQIITAQEARLGAERRLAELQTKLKSMEESLIQTERALGQVSKNLQLSEEQRIETEKRLQEALKQRQGVADQTASLRDSEKRLQAQVSNYESHLRAAEATLRETESALAQVSGYYQTSENARVEAEMRMAELLHDQEALRGEVQRLSGIRNQWTRELEGTRTELKLASENLRRLEAELENQRAEFEQRLREEIEVRRDLESQILVAARREAEARSQMERLREQIGRTLPELQNAMRSLVDPTSEGPDVSSE